MADQGSAELKNLRTDVLGDWSWDPSQPVESLNRLRDAGIACAADCIEWYNREKKMKQSLAKWLRTSAIVMFGFSALLLLCSQQPEGVSSAWATATIIVAGTLIAIDSFFGLTNGWIRFIEAANSLRVEMHMFKIDWERQASEWSGDPSTEQVTAAITLARSFVASVDQIVTDEISEWATQFRTSVTRQNARADSVLEGTLPQPAATTHNTTNSPATNTTATNNTAADNTAADNTAADNTAADNTATGNTATPPSASPAKPATGASTRKKRKKTS